MDKKERYNVLKKCKAQTWYTFCLVEAMYDKDVEISAAKLVVKLGVSVATLKKYINSWGNLELIKLIPRGFSVAQIDGQPDGITGEVKECKFKKAKDMLVIRITT